MRLNLGNVRPVNVPLTAEEQSVWRARPHRFLRELAKVGVSSCSIRSYALLQTGHSDAGGVDYPKRGIFKIRQSCSFRLLVTYSYPTYSEERSGAETWIKSSLLIRVFVVS